MNEVESKCYNLTNTAYGSVVSAVPLATAAKYALEDGAYKRSKPLKGGVAEPYCVINSCSNAAEYMHMNL
jgi:hypothetical protein